MEEVLVTGGTGFVARRIIADLLIAGHRVRTTVRSAAKESVVTSAVSEVVDPAGRLTFVHVDLLSDAGWDAAVAGVRRIIHPASPLGSGDAASIIATAREGTERVLRAGFAAGAERIVVTSAANTSSHTDYRTRGTTDELLWTDPDAEGIDVYRRSKTLAEREAWDIAAELGATQRLSTILPGAVLGPVLGADHPGTTHVVGRLLRGEVSRVPHIGFEVVDVRDVSAIHVRAAFDDAAAGQRFLATGELMWWPDMARLLSRELGADGSRVSARSVPDFMVRRMARKRPEMRAIVGSLGRKNVHTTEKARRLLGWSPRPAAETVIDCARSLRDHGLV